MIRYLLLLVVLFTPLAQAADVNLLIDIMECESGGYHYTKKGRINAGDDGVSVGIAQFQRVTFEELKRKAHHPEWKWRNPIHQMRLLNWAVDHGYGHLWTCYRKLRDAQQTAGTGN